MSRQQEGARVALLPPSEAGSNGGVPGEDEEAVPGERTESEQEELVLREGSEAANATPSSRRLRLGWRSVAGASLLLGAAAAAVLVARPSSFAARGLGSLRLAADTGDLVLQAQVTTSTTTKATTTKKMRTTTTTTTTDKDKKDALKKSLLTLDENGKKKKLAGVAATVDTVVTVASTVAALGLKIKQRDQFIQQASARYSETTAWALAAVAKLTWCGKLPGTVPSLALSCGRNPVAFTNVKGVCARDGWAVSRIRTQSASEPILGPLSDPDAHFSFAAKYKTFGADATFPDKGCLVAFRGSLETVTNQFVYTDSSLEKLELPNDQKCPGDCRVYKGVQNSFQKLLKPLQDDLKAMKCKPTSKITFTGIGTGGTMAVLAMTYFQALGYEVTSTILFSPLMAGNADFTNYFMKIFDQDNPCFRVTHRADLWAAMPKNPLQPYVPQCVEVHYPGDSAGDYTFHLPGESGGAASYKDEDLSAANSCESPVAYDKSLCKFHNEEAICVNGMGFESDLIAPSSLFKLGNPLKLPLAGRGRLPLAFTEFNKIRADLSRKFVPNFLKPRGQKPLKTSQRLDILESNYEPDVARFFGFLVKITGCGGQGLDIQQQQAIVKTCQNQGPKVGITCPSWAVKTFSTSVALPGSEDSVRIFGYCLKYLRSNSVKTSFGAEGFLCVIRGPVFDKSFPRARTWMNNDQLVLCEPLDNSAYVHQGYCAAMQKLREKVVDALKGASAKPNSNNDVQFAGFGSGAAVAQLLTLALRYDGYNSLPPYLFESPRVGDQGFVDLLCRDQPVCAYALQNHEADTEEWGDLAHGFADLPAVVRFTALEEDGAPEFIKPAWESTTTTTKKPSRRRGRSLKDKNKDTTATTTTTIVNKYTKENFDDDEEEITAQAYADAHCPMAVGPKKNLCLNARDHLPVCLLGFGL